MNEMVSRLELLGAGAQQVCGSILPKDVGTPLSNPLIDTSQRTGSRKVRAVQRLSCSLSLSLSLSLCLSPLQVPLLETIKVSVGAARQAD